jgi:hypothetical protein
VGGRGFGGGNFAETQFNKRNYRGYFLNLKNNKKIKMY